MSITRINGANQLDDGSLTPLKISTNVSDDFIFPHYVGIGASPTAILYATGSSLTASSKTGVAYFNDSQEVGIALGIPHAHSIVSHSAAADNGWIIPAREDATGMTFGAQAGLKVFTGSSTQVSTSYSDKDNTARYFTLSPDPFSATTFPVPGSTFTIGGNTYTIRMYRIANHRLFVYESISGEAASGTLTNIAYATRALNIDTSQLSTFSNSVTISKSDDARMELTDTGDVSTLRLRSDGANASMGMVTNHPLSIVTNNTSAIYIDTNQNIGIGTLTPNLTSFTKALTVSAGITGSAQAGLELQGSNTSNDFPFAQIKGFNHTTASAVMRFMRHTADDDGYILWQTKTTGQSIATVMTLDVAGNLGIGPTPIVKLHVASTGTPTTPANSGTTPSTGTLFRMQANSNAVLDFGSNSSTYSWIQSTDQTGMNTSYPLALNPNGGDVFSKALTDYSGISTITGWASFTTKILQYKKIGKTTYVWFDLRGTSNSTSTSFTLPVANSSSLGVVPTAIQISDNGSNPTTAGLASIPNASSTVTMYKDFSGATWTASGTKFCIGCLIYEAAS